MNQHLEIIHKTEDSLSNFVHDLRYCFNRIQVRTYLTGRPYGCFVQIIVKPRNRAKTFLNVCLKIQCNADIVNLHQMLDSLKNLCQNIFDNYIHS